MHTGHPMSFHRISAFSAILAAALTIAPLPALVVAQTTRTVVESFGTATRSSTSSDSVLFGALQWRNIGPNRGGRSIGAAGSTSRPLEYYFGATGGGLWKTTDGGTTWEPVTDGKITSSSVGAVAVCEANPDVVYIGTGETQLRGNIMQGDGVYKSTDAGKTWRHMGLRETQNIARVRVHPTDCNQVLVAAFGHHGAANPERGIFRSTDGGATWTKTLYRDDKSGGVDLVIHPKDPNTVYAALWEAWRKPWAMSSGGPGSGLFKSTDGGRTFTEISRNQGLPRGMLGKIGVAVSPVDANRVFAIIEADSGGVFRSDDGGRTWTLTNDERKLRQRAFYYTRIYADPIDRDRVYVLNVGMFRSDDGGKTFNTQIRPPHSDQHDLWIAANDNQRMINSNDGGGNVSVNGGRTWTAQDFPTAQMYRVGISSHTPYLACGGQQDNSTICVPSQGWEHLTAGDQVYFAVGGGESGYVAPHPTNTNIYFAGSYGGTLDRFDYATGQARAVNVWPDNPMGYSAIDIKERFQWTFPIVFSPHDPNVIYTSSQHVWRSTNEGQSWERISPDLTRADPKTLGPSGGPITLDQTGVETYGTVFTIAPSPVDRNIIWTGSDDGVIHITRDNARTWTKVAPADMPEYMRIGTVEASPHKAGTAYVAGNRYLLDDFTPYLYRTDDYGRTWTRITTGIPNGAFLRSVREDKVRPGLLFAGTEKGVYASWDNGASWRSLSLNLPLTQVSDLAVKDNDLVIATHGRSFWVLPNIGILRQITDVVRVSDMSGGATKPVHLFAPAPAIRGIDPGVMIDYYLERPPRALTLDFLDASGRVIRSYTGRPTPAPTAARADSARRDSTRATGLGAARTDSIRTDSARAAAGAPAPQDGPGAGGPAPTMRAGTNRFVWDLRYPGFTTFPGMILWSAGNNGPVAVPGRYQVRLTVDGLSQTQPFEVKIDPRLKDVTVADLQKRFDLAIQLRDRVSQANEAVIAIRSIKSQVDERIRTANRPVITGAGETLKQAISAIEGELYQVRNRSNQDPLNYPIKLNNKIAALIGTVESAEAAPTAQSHDVFRDLATRLDAELRKLNDVYGSGLEAFNRLLRQNGLPPITPPPLKM
jgi:photosystem II stability/assembly factor-like uncharacterized protein